MGRRLAAAAGLLLALCAAGCWVGRDRRQTLTAQVSAPGPTPLTEGARPQPLVVDFDGSAARLEQIGRAPSGGVTLSPPQAGQWRWDSDSRLVFTPSQDWPVGRDFTVTLGSQLLPPQVKLKRRALSFQTAPFTARIADARFYVDPADPRLKNVLVTVRFSHPVDAQSLESRVSLAYRQKAPTGLLAASGRYPFTVSYDKRGGQAFIRSAPVPIPADDAQMTVRLAAGARALQGGPAFDKPLEATVRVPGMYEFFHVQDARLAIARNENDEPQQVLALELTAGALEKDVLDSLEAWVLPADKPAARGRPAQKNAWYSADEVGPELLAASTPLALVPIPADREYAPAQAFRVEAPPGRFVFLLLKKGLQAYGGYSLARDYETALRAPDYPKELRLMHDGAILSLGGQRTLSVVAEGVSDVSFEVGRVLPGEVSHLVSQSGGDFAHPLFEEPRFGEDDIVERFTQRRALKRLPPGQAQYLSFDFSPYLGKPGQPRRGLFFLRAREWDAVHNRPTGLEDRRFILLTDLGVIAKAASDGTRQVYVQNLRTGLPVAGADVEVLGRNGLAVVSAPTDAGGAARFPSLRDFKREKAPVAYLVRAGDDLSFLPYDRADRRLDFSRFDSGGAEDGGRPDRLSAFLFTDRGLYRPGEEIHAGAVVRALDWARPLAGLPVEAVVTDPRGLEVDRRRIALSQAAFEELSYRTQENGPTGDYDLSLYLVKDNQRQSLLGSTRARVEEFLPDRLRLSAAFDPARETGWVSPNGLRARVSLQNLFGTPAQDRRVTATLTLAPAAPALPDFPGYAFYDPALAKKSFSSPLAEARTDAEGRAELDLDLARFSAATYRATLSVEGFEAAGGRGVGAQASVLVSPRPYLIGVKRDGDLSYVHRGSRRTVELAAAGPDGRAVSVSGVSAVLIERRWVSALVKQEDGAYRYQSVEKEVSLSTRAVSVPASGARLALDASKPGDFSLVLRDPAGTELNRVDYTVAGAGNLTRSLEKSAELELKLSKSDYAPGETVELQLKAPYAGSGLITIERDKVYAHKWFTMETTASTQTIRLPEGLEGNGYVSVTLLRAIGSRQIFASPLSYAAAPFSVSRARRTLPLDLKAPALVEPGQRVTLRFKTARPSRVAVFAVDEGILQAAGYATPDPLGFFFRKRALEVQTFQILDLLLPEYRIVQDVMAAGGDKGAEAVGKNLNPFKRRRDKPAVFWSGLRDAGPDWREVSLDVPDTFNGRLRVMAVAVSPDAVGVAETATVSRAPLVLTVEAPLFAAPGDEFEASVGVANAAKGSGPDASVLVTLQTSAHLQVLDGAQRRLALPEGREGTVSFKMRARDSLGSADLVLTASTGRVSSRQKTSLSVRPASPYAVEVESGWLRRGHADAALPRRLYPAYRKLEVSASHLPLGLSGGLLAYLEEYPYGCTEQLVSEAFPLLALRRYPDFGYAPERVQKNIDATLAMLRSRQTADGSFGYWAANSFTSDFINAYAMHFLVEARDDGIAVPEEMLDRGLSYLEQVGRTPGGSLSDARARAYSLYVLTRAGRVTTQDLTTLRQRLEESKDPSWRRDATAVYMAGAYRLLRLDDDADRLISGPRLADDEPSDADYENFYDPLVRNASLLYVLARHFPEKLGAVTDADLRRLVQPVLDNRFNTLSSAYTILALSAYADAVGAPKGLEARVTQRMAGGQDLPLPLSGGLFARAEASPQAERLRFEASGAHGLFYQSVQAGFDRQVPAAPVKNGLEVERELLGSDGKPIVNVSLGQELTERVRLRAVGRERAPGIAVVDLLPAGFDLVLEPSDPEPAPGEWTPDYVDRREDRVVLFGAAAAGVQEFSYKVRAVSRGRFVVPPAFAQGMYDRSLEARSAPGQVEVR